MKNFIKWLKEKKGIILCDTYIDEYEKSLNIDVLSINDVLEHVAKIYNVTVLDLKMIREGRFRGNNQITLAKGMLVKCVLSNPKLKMFSTVNVYEKLFGQKKDHSTAFYWREYSPPVTEFKLYYDLTKWIDSHKINWND